MLKKTLDTDSAQNLIQEYLRKLNPEAENNWALCGKVPWKGYLKKKFKNRKEEFEAKALHVECEKGTGEELLDLLRRWKKSRFAEKRSGEHMRIIEVLKLDTSSGKNEREICMTCTGRRLYCSIDMVSLMGMVDMYRVVEVR